MYMTGRQAQPVPPASRLQHCCNPLHSRNVSQGEPALLLLLTLRW